MQQQGIKKTTTEKFIEAEALIREFQAMRKLQVEYFVGGRKTDVLQQSKIQERKVDQMIKEYFATSSQGDLFKSGPEVRSTADILYIIERLEKDLKTNGMNPDARASMDDEIKSRIAALKWVLGEYDIGMPSIK